MKPSIFVLPFLPFAVAGILSAQTAAAPAQGRMLDRLSAKLNLTHDQQNQAKTIFGKARADEKALGPKIHQERMALKNAVKSDNETQIDAILQQNSQVNVQARAIHAKAMARFYQILTPAQKAQFDQMRPHRQPARAS